jgi:signal transduction histidine kinase
MQHTQGDSSSIQATSSPNIPWRRRLSLRMALMFGAAILLFNIMREPLFNVAWGLVSDQNTEHADENILSDPQTLTHRFEELISQRDGKPVLENAAANQFAKSLRRQFYSFVWVNGEGKVAGVPDDLTIPLGSPWDFGSGEAVPVVRGEEGGISGLAFLENFALGRDLGTLVLVDIEIGEPGSELPPSAETDTQVMIVSADSPLLLPDTRDDEEFRRFQLLRQVVSVVIAMALAGLLALMVAWFITRRLARLARDARVSMEVDALPEPFRTTGVDEISSLAESLNLSRERMAALLQEVQKRDRTRREWIAQVSHDIRTPLTALAACIERAEASTIDVDDHGLRTKLSLMLHTAKADIDRLNTLTGDLLESARLDLDESLHMEEVLPAEVVRHTMATIRSFAQREGIRIDTDIPRGLPVLHGDGSRLMRAFENLMKNAIQHANERVFVKLESDELEFRFIVTDDGPGLPEKDGEVILVAKGKNPDKEDSSGLGLIVTRKVVEAHEGKLVGENLPQGGAKLMIRLPVSDLDTD